MRRKSKNREAGENIALEEIKRCPECFISLPMNARRCPSCRTRVGRRNKHGIARKATNWISYVVCIVSWTILILYVKWAFLS